MPVNPAGRLLGCRVLAAVVLAFACALATPGIAGAESFFVNSTADEVDATPGDEFCVTAAGKCTLRAAIEEANSSVEEFDAISFEEEIFEGDDDSVIEPASALPAITTPLSLSGRLCETEAGMPGPCVEIDGFDDDPALSVEGVANVEIETLALTGAKAGIAADASPGLRVRGSWFGVGLDGAAAGNETGILLGPGSDGARIGGEGPEARNFIAGSTVTPDGSGTGLEILGASNVRILGNRFGVTPSGADAPNDTALRISSFAEPGEERDAVDNTVGTRVSAAAAASADCDGGCNLISGSNSNGIDLAGEGEARSPAIGTTIAGNQIGLDPAGSGSVPNVGTGILVGSAPRTTIGGPRSGDENRIAGGTTAVEAGPAAPDLTVRGNLIGSGANAAGTAAAPQDGLLIDSSGLSFPTEEAHVLENRIGLDGGVGISLIGLGALVSGNQVAGAGTGIELKEAGSENLIDSNLVEAADFGILVEGSFNTIVGNVIGGGQKTGVRIQGSDLFGVSGNVIGGDTAAAENTINGSAGDAIEIENPRLSLNEVARNRGSGNGGLFIDLTPSPPHPDDLEPGDPNNAILPPAIVSISEAGGAGFAEPGARVRVFRKATMHSGEIASFLGHATADENGNWSLAFPAPLPPGTAIAATQTKEEGTSELEITTVPVPAGRQQPPPAVAVPVDRKPPRTRMLRQPRRVGKSGVARFAFTSNEPGSRFQCSIDRKKFRACKSPKKYRGLRPGKHLFRVRAIDAAGNVDRTPLRRRFKVLG